MPVVAEQPQNIYVSVQQSSTTTVIINHYYSSGYMMNYPELTLAQNNLSARINQTYCVINPYEWVLKIMNRPSRDCGRF